MRKRGGIKKRPGLKKGLSTSLNPRSGKLKETRLRKPLPPSKKDKGIEDVCTKCGFQSYATFLYCPHCSAINRKRVSRPVDRCAKCGSTNVGPVQPFDYIKMCYNNKCSYHVGHPKGWRYQWHGEHN
jgi:hypothetical protein